MGESVGAYYPTYTLYIVVVAILSRKHPNLTERTIVGMYLAGNSIMKIHLATMIQRETVRSILHAHNIQMRHRHEIYHEPEIKMNGRVALLLGLHAGDGHLSDSWGLSINKKDVEMEQAIIALVRTVLGVEPFIDSSRDGYVVVRSGKEQVHEFFERYGFRRGKKAGTVKVPSEILASENRKVWIGFLRGAFSSDGCFWFKNHWGQCRFEVSSKRFRDGFILLARKLDFCFRAYTYVHRGGHNKLPLHLAYLGVREEVRRWMEQVGSLSDTHLRRYEEWSRRITR